MQFYAIRSNGMFYVGGRPEGSTFSPHTSECPRICEREVAERIASRIPAKADVVVLDDRELR